MEDSRQDLRRRARAFVAAVALATAVPAAAEDGRWRIEGALGGAYSFDSTLTLAQGGFPPLDISASWENRNFETPLYNGVRLARQDSRGAWAIRLVHLKIYLSNPPDEVQRFNVSHGYNLLTLERSFLLSGFDLWVGAGIVIAPQESTVRGLPSAENSGYVVTGPTAAVALDRRVRLSDHFALVPEVRLTFSRAKIPIALGEASVPNVSVHALFGLEFRF